MGYMGLEGWVASDSAADWRGAMIDSMVESLEKCIRDKGNKYNTDGAVNVALILEDETIFGKMDSLTRHYFKGVATEAMEKLNKHIEVVDKILANPDTDKSEKDGFLYHRKSYKRMVKNLTKFLKGTEEWDS